MANAKIIKQKALVVDEIKNKFEKAKSVVVFDPRGLKVSEVTELRRALRDSGSDYKVYKNTLAKRAVDSLNIGLGDYLEGPSAISFSSDVYAAIPSREGLLTMLAAGLMGTVRDLSICLDLYSKEKEEN